MAEVKFGASQKSAPTPAGHSRVIDIISAVSGVLITWLTTASYIPSEVSNVIASILGGLTTLAQVLKPYFGVQIDSNTVKTEDVSVIESNNSKTN